jgi:hypothetical protein
MRDSTALPDLRMLPSQLLIPHEDSDPRRLSNLAERLRQDGYLKHPPISAAIPGTDQFVVLDGANRSMAMILLDIPHIVTQIVSYGDPGLSLDTWHHVISGMSLEEFEAALLATDDLETKPCTLLEAREALATNNALAYIALKEGVRIVCGPQGCPDPNIEILSAIVNAYRGRADIFRASNDVWELQEPFYPGMIAIVVFPRIMPSDILTTVKNGGRVPSGITRHIIPNRALNINIPMDVMAADWGLAKKQAWLHEWLMEKMASNSIRFYAEATFTFDE